jgi:hypothetical protein
MNEDIRKHLAALNTAWQRYAIAREQELDTIPMDALSHDLVVALEGLATYGITESMLVYDSVTMTFSLPDDG